MQNLTYYADVENFSVEAFQTVFPELRPLSLEEMKRQRYVYFMFIDGWAMFNRQLWDIRTTYKSRITANNITDKVELHRLLTEKAPELIPETIIITPDQTPIIPNTNIPWIYRENVRGGKGEGVDVITTQEELNALHTRLRTMPLKRGATRNALLTRYITDPLLVSIEGNFYKFHIRLYLIVVVVTGNPAANRAGFYYFGEVALARSPYNPNYKDKLSQDTHLSHGKFGFPENYPYPTLPLYNKLTDMFSKIMSLTVPYLEGYPESEVGYQIFGADILVDQNERPWLLEINQSPGLTDDPPGRKWKMSYILLQGVREFVVERKPANELKFIRQLI